MIGYVTIGTSDLARAAAFYDALLAELGAKRTFQMDHFIMWSTGEGQPALCVIYPFDKNPASVGNGVMVALAAGSRDKVDAVYRKAIELGAKDEGAAGQRFPGFYAGYFRDLDGNKLNAFVMG